MVKFAVNFSVPGVGYLTLEIQALNSTQARSAILAMYPNASIATITQK